jgi:hypothetical protein
MGNLARFFGGGDVAVGAKTTFYERTPHVHIDGTKVYVRTGTVLSDQNLIDTTFWRFGRLNLSTSSVLPTLYGNVLGIATPCQIPSTGRIVIPVQSASGGPKGTVVSDDGGVGWSFFLNNIGTIITNGSLNVGFWHPGFNRVIYLASQNDHTWIFGHSTDGVAWTIASSSVADGTHGWPDWYAASPNNFAVLRKSRSDTGTHSRFAIEKANNLTNTSPTRVTVDVNTSSNWWPYGIVWDGTNYVVMARFSGGTAFRLLYANDSTFSFTLGAVVDTSGLSLPRTFSFHLLPGGGSFRNIVPYSDAAGNRGFYYSNNSGATMTDFPLGANKTYFLSYAGFFDNKHWTNGEEGRFYTTTDFVNYVEVDHSMPTVLTSQRVFVGNTIGGFLAGTPSATSSGSFVDYVRAK